MTLLDLLKLLKHYLKLVILIVLVCAIAGGALGAMKAKTALSAEEEVSELEQSAEDRYMARAAVIVSTQVGGVGGIASIEADKWNQENNKEYSDWILYDAVQKGEELAEAQGTTPSYNPPSFSAEQLDAFDQMTIVETKTYETANYIRIKATGPKAEECVQAANDVAMNTELVANEVYSKRLNIDEEEAAVNNKNIELTYTEGMTIEIAKATKATAEFDEVSNIDIANATKKSSGAKSSTVETTSASPIKTVLKFLLVGIVAGIVLAIIIVVLIDVIRRPVRDGEKIAGALEVPLIADPQTEKHPAMLLANVRFAAGEGAEKVCVVSAGDDASASTIFAIISQARKNNDIDLIDAGAITGSATAAYDVSESDGVLLCMREWSDTLRQVESAASELSLIGAKLIGVVVVPEKA